MRGMFSAWNFSRNDSTCVVTVWVKVGVRVGALTVKDDFSQELNMSQNRSKAWAIVHGKWQKNDSKWIVNVMD
jgi:hypothetical protein